LNKLDHYLSPGFVRESAKTVLEATIAGKTHFTYHPELLSSTCDYVMEVIRENYPDLRIPFHSRWGHFRVGGVDRESWYRELHRDADPIEYARLQFDLVIPSVLLDAGAGPHWGYHEARTGQTHSRSEGLGVASFHLFFSGALRPDAKGMQSLTPELLAQAFQVSPENPLVGLEGRCELIRNLGKVLDNPVYFKQGRPGNLVDYLIERYGPGFEARDVLQAVLLALGPIWPGRIEYEGVNLGDVWAHSSLGWLGFHKLSQWMTYSLLEPLMAAGIGISRVDSLTGLAEYRNGGLFLDSGLIRFKDEGLAAIPLPPSSDPIIEWRGLTVALLDAVATEIQRRLGKKAGEFPLAKVLEGGTWWAGRKIAREKRNTSEPPLRIASDGTVF
jgi:hypothetical protein